MMPEESSETCSAFGFSIVVGWLPFSRDRPFPTVGLEADMAGGVIGELSGGVGPGEDIRPGSASISGAGEDFIMASRSLDWSIEEADFGEVASSFLKLVRTFGGSERWSGKNDDISGRLEPEGDLSEGGRTDGGASFPCLAWTSCEIVF